MKIRFWRNAAGRTPALEDMESELDAKALKRIAKRFDLLGRYTYEQAVKSQTLVKVPDGNGLWETRFILPNGWARLMTVLEDPGPIADFLTFFMKKQGKLPEHQKKRAQQNATEFRTKSPPRDGTDAAEWAAEKIK